MNRSSQNERLIIISVGFAENMRLETLDRFMKNEISDLDFAERVGIFQQAALEAILMILNEEIKTQAELERRLEEIIRVTWPEFTLRFRPKLSIVKN